jgi:hypothetical protein
MTPSKEDAERLKIEVETANLRIAGDKAKAEVRKAGIDADKAATEAQTPTPPTTVTAPEGKVSVEDKDGMVGRMVAYRLLDKAAEEMHDAIVSTAEHGVEKRILLVESRDLIGSDWPHRVVDSQLGSEAAALAAALAGLPSPAPPGPPVQADVEAPEGDDVAGGGPQGLVFPPVAAAQAGIAAVTTAASLVGMFRTDYAISGGEVKIGNTPLLAATAEYLRDRGCAVIVDGFDLLDGALVDRFWEARALRIELEQQVMGLRTGYGAADLGDATVPAGSEEARARLAEAEVAIKVFDEFTKAVTVAPATGGPPLLVTAAQRERLHLPPGDSRAISHVLYVAIEGGGQAAITKRKLFGRSGRMNYLGGAQVSYLLYDVAKRDTVAAGSEQLMGSVGFDVGKAEAGSLKPISLE